LARQWLHTAVGVAMAPHVFSATACHYLAATYASRVMVSPPVD
jgi:hypothetical protein